jgi:hypothetical protein
MAGPFEEVEGEAEEPCRDLLSSRGIKLGGAGRARHHCTSIRPRYNVRTGSCCAEFHDFLGLSGVHAKIPAVSARPGRRAPASRP